MVCKFFSIASGLPKRRAGGGVTSVKLGEQDVEMDGLGVKAIVGGGREDSFFA